MTEGADRTFVWTDEDKERTARSSLAVEAVRRGHISGEEALTMVILGKPDTPEYMAAVAKRIEEIPFPEPRREQEARETKRERESKRYHEDADYRKRCLDRRKKNRDTDAYREKERERARRRRAERKARS